MRRGVTCEGETDWRPFGEKVRESAARRWGKFKHAPAWCACKAKHTILEKSYSHQGSANPWFLTLVLQFG